MTRPTVGMAMIVRDEAERIERCLGSFWGHVDRVAILDTGSTDGTLEAVQHFADHAVGLPTELRIGTFKWVDDFAAARRAADELLGDVDWTCWIDADDLLYGAPQLRGLAAQAPDRLAALGFGYDYMRDEHGNSVCYLRRERLVRRGRGHWHGAVHEAQTIDGPIEWVDPTVVEWRHHKAPEAGGGSSERNIRILRKWARREPANPRVLSYLGTELAGRGDIKGALRWFRRYLKTETSWPEERAQIHRKIAGCHFEQGDVASAMEMALQALTVHPTWPDSYLTLAEAHYRLGEYEKAATWARRVIELGEPETLLIVNPLDYTFQPRLILAGALGELGQHTEAIRVADDALRIVPDEPRVAGAAAKWRSLVKREQTADHVTGLASLLAGHDEQAKALQVLDSAPYFVTDHPRVVSLRSQIRERVHAATGDRQPNPERVEHDDQTARTLAARLPRVGFLLDGLAEQAAA